MLFALLAGAAWAAYILLSAQTGRRWPGLDGLAVASVVATLLLTPRGRGRAGGGGLLDPRILLLGAAVGLLSSVIPYSCEMAALRTPPARGVQHPDEPGAGRGGAGRRSWCSASSSPPVQWLAMACVVVASVGATRQPAE